MLDFLTLVYGSELDIVRYLLWGQKLQIPSTFQNYPEKHNNYKL